MKCIVLAAGKDKNSIEKTPKCLRMVNNKTVLDSFIDTLHNECISNINLVGGFEILQIMEKHPDLNYFYNERWRDTKSLYSLSKAFKAFDSSSLISYSDTIHKSERFKLINQDKINIFYDSENMYMTSFLKMIADNIMPLTPVYINNGWIEIDEPTDLNFGRFLQQQEMNFASI